MMSSMEKHAQVGEFVQKRQEAKVALEHLKVKSSKIAAAYSAFGSTPDRWRTDDTHGRGDLFLLLPKGDERQHPEFLLGASQLADHVREVVTAEVALAGIKSQLSALGIND